MNPYDPTDRLDGKRVICPYCSHSRKADPCDGDGEQEPVDEECGNCGKEFIRFASISITYHTKQKPS